jgi:hypothetical protein
MAIEVEQHLTKTNFLRLWLMAYGPNPKKNAQKPKLIMSEILNTYYKPNGPKPNQIMSKRRSFSEHRTPTNQRNHKIKYVKYNGNRRIFS